MSVITIHVCNICDYRAEDSHITPPGWLCIDRVRVYDWAESRRHLCEACVLLLETELSKRATRNTK